MWMCSESRVCSCQEKKKRERKVRSMLPQAECHLSWEDLYHCFDVFHSSFSVQSLCTVIYFFKSKDKRQCTSIIVYF